jgi:hypothetical protein
MMKTEVRVMPLLEEGYETKSWAFRSGKGQEVTLCWSL